MSRAPSQPQSINYYSQPPASQPWETALYWEIPRFSLPHHPPSNGQQSEYNLQVSKIPLFNQNLQISEKSPLWKGVCVWQGVHRAVPAQGTGSAEFGVRFCGNVGALADRQGGAWLFRHRALQPSARFPLAPVPAAGQETFAQLPINHLFPFNRGHSALSCRCPAGSMNGWSPTIGSFYFYFPPPAPGLPCRAVTCPLVSQGDQPAGWPLSPVVISFQ